MVPLFGDDGQPLHAFSKVIEHYMLQSEQLDTTLVLAANDQRAAGLLIQRLPVIGEGNLSARSTRADEDQIGRNEDYNRIAILTASLQREELLTLDADTLVHRLFWEEQLVRFEPTTPRFACACSEDRVRQMIRSLGQEEAQSVIDERDELEVGCDFCGRQYHFDAVDVAQIFKPESQAPGSTSLQ